MTDVPVHRCHLFGVECVTSNAFRLNSGAKCGLKSCLECQALAENFAPVNLDSAVPILNRWRLPLAEITGCSRNYNPGMCIDNRIPQSCWIAWRAQHRLGQPSQIWLGWLSCLTGEVFDAKRLNLGGKPSAEDPRLQWIGNEIWLTYASFEPADPTRVEQRRAILDTAGNVLADLAEISPFGRAMEKNWTHFDTADGPRLLYTPHHVIGESTTSIRPFSATPVLFDARGSCPPLRVGNEFFVIAHSVIRNPTRYVASVYTFDASPPFRVRRVLRVPLLRAVDGDDGNGKQVIFPSGATFDEASGTWRMAYGLHDRWAEVIEFKHDDLLRAMT